MISTKACKLAGIVVMLALGMSGCTETTTPSSTDEQKHITTQTPIVTTTTHAPIQNPAPNTSSLESRIEKLEYRVSETEKIIEYNGLMEQVDKDLIPSPPFSIKTQFKDNLSYFFGENGEVEITEKNDVIPIIATYEINHNNNTIKITSKGKRFITTDHDYYHIRLFEKYIAAVFDNGWIQWVETYEIETNTSSEWKKYE